MSHWLLRLCQPNKQWGSRSEILQEVHKDIPRAEYGWSRRMKADRSLYAVLRVCTFEDEACRPYNAWLELKGAHEDEAEAEALRGADA